MRVVFRADASVMIGTGHVMRCLTLADALRARGAHCHFVTRALAGHPGALIEARGFAVSLLPEPSDDTEIAGPPAHANWAGVTWQQDLEETLDVVSTADWLIVDHYAFDARWQRGFAGRIARVMVIDDLADRPHHAALLLDQNLGSAASDYRGLLPVDCSCLIGPRFALLRPEFAAQRAESLAQRKDRKPSHLMITMGGMDANDATSSVLRVLAGIALPTEARLSIVMGSRAPALERVQALAAEMPWPSEVLVDVQNMAELMTGADLAIAAAGSTTWELCCLGVPSVLVQTADNQAGAVTAMSKAGAALSPGDLSDPTFGKQLAETVGELLNRETNLRIAANAAKQCDGNGAQCVAASLWEY
ncbi:UDP-2,4-diacetamido-2,4,6-trideoxy-beta-L-altropyranose hydrolase [Rhodobacteraceae bacterium M385]|nr:UDP-2,4-diacetamido-2,4,6-trideoxy-beta-L-altropyranose hydrolase [Rhodobacteraceae bacterium M385]